jgi:HEAT repeat protein
VLLVGGLLLLLLAAYYIGHIHWGHVQLAKALHDPDPVVRMDAVRQAGQGGREDLVIEALKDEDPDIRFVAAWELGGHGEKKVRALLELFKDDQAYVRELALKKLRYLPAGGRPFLYKGVEDADPRVRAGTAYSLVYLPSRKFVMGDIPANPPPRPPDEEKTIAHLLIPLMKDENLEVRKAAYFSLFSYWLDDQDSQQVAAALEEAPPETDKDARDLSERLSRWMKQRKPARDRSSE